jgi:hypothetical protein
MPSAVVDSDSTEKFELKSLPTAYVVLRKMTYGQKLVRQQNAMKMSIEQKGRGRKGTSQGNVEMMQLQSAVFDFKACVVEHNLTDNSGAPLNLSTEFDIQRLDPVVGEEISSLIDDMNNFEPEDDRGNSGTVSA